MMEDVEDSTRFSLIIPWRSKAEKCTGKAQCVNSASLNQYIGKRATIHIVLNLPPEERLPHCTPPSLPCLIRSSAKWDWLPHRQDLEPKKSLFLENISILWESCLVLPLKNVFVATNRRRRKQNAKRMGFIRKFHIFFWKLEFWRTSFR